MPTIDELAVLLRYFENTRVFLTFLEIKNSVDIHILGICKSLNISRKTDEGIVRKFEKDGLIEVSRKMGKTKMYRLKPEFRNESH